MLPFMTSHKMIHMSIFSLALFRRMTSGATQVMVNPRCAIMSVAAIVLAMPTSAIFARPFMTRMLGLLMSCGQWVAYECVDGKVPM